jgi:hypothetical protein
MMIGLKASFPGGNLVGQLFGLTYPKLAID